MGEPSSWRCEGLQTSWQSTRLIFGLPQLSPLLTTQCIAFSAAMIALSVLTALQVVLSAQCSVHQWLRAAAGCSLLSHTPPPPPQCQHGTTTTTTNKKMSTWHTHDHLHNQHHTSSTICSPPNNTNMTQTQSTSLPTSTGYKLELKSRIFESLFKAI